VKASVTTELILSALDGLLTHKLRSGLTALGVIFGVAAVIGMSSIGEGARREALAQIELMGSSNIIIEEARPSENDPSYKEVTAKNPVGLSVADAEALKATLKEVVRVVAERSAELPFTAGARSARLNSVASTPELFDLYNLRLTAGRRFNWLDEADCRRVCVLGGGAKRELFPLESAVGKEIRAAAMTLTVIGVLERQAVGGELEGFAIQDRNRDVYVPLETARKRLPPQRGESELQRIVVQLKDVSQMEGYAAVIRSILRRRHHEVDDFRVVVPEELLRQHNETQRIFNIVMGTIASISLLVGGIGIMNIMLVSVSERTREIGLRKSLGATSRNILWQFLIESLIITGLGGLAGIVWGALVSLAAGLIVRAQGLPDWPLVISWLAIGIAFTLSTVIGLTFGVYPARRAAALNPIEALRYE